METQDSSGAVAIAPPLKRFRSSIEPSPRESQHRGTISPHVLLWAEALPMLPPPALPFEEESTAQSEAAERGAGLLVQQALRR